MSSFADVIPEVTAVCLLKIGVTSRPRLCTAITLDHWFQHCAATEQWFYTNCPKFSITEMKERMQNIFLPILYREILTECIQHLTGLSESVKESLRIPDNL